jgi:choline dehydrogenase-like flavoprotein
VLVLEGGKRFRNEDFPKSNWIIGGIVAAGAALLRDSTTQSNPAGVGTARQRRRRRESRLRCAADGARHTIVCAAMLDTGRRAVEGVIGLDGQVHSYRGLCVVDGSIIPANPGVNPRLTIAAMAENVMSQIGYKTQRNLSAFDIC